MEIWSVFYNVYKSYFSPHRLKHTANTQQGDFEFDLLGITLNYKIVYELVRPSK